MWTIWITHKHHDNMREIVHMTCFSTLRLYEWVIVQCFHRTLRNCHVLSNKPQVTKYSPQFFFSHIFLLHSYFKIDYITHMCSGVLLNRVFSHPPLLGPFVPGLPRFVKVSWISADVFCLQIIEATTLFLCTNAADFFSVFFPDLWLSTILFGRSTANTVTSWIVCALVCSVKFWILWTRVCLPKSCPTN